MSTRIPREKVVFLEALEIADLGQRRRFLDQACGADQVLRQQVEKLLALKIIKPAWVFVRLLLQEADSMIAQAPPPPK